MHFTDEEADGTLRVKGRSCGWSLSDVAPLSHRTGVRLDRHHAQHGDPAGVRPAVAAGDDEPFHEPGDLRARDWIAKSIVGRDPAFRGIPGASVRGRAGHRVRWSFL